MAKYMSPSEIIADKEFEIFGVKVKEYLIVNHNINGITLPTKRVKPLKGITIHNTNDLANIEDDGRNYTASTVNGNMRTVRVHYYVDDLYIWQNLDESLQNWTCTDGNGDGNATTIAIECIMKNSYDTESIKAMDNCARLTAYLCVKYKLTTNDVYTHTYWLHMRDKDSISKCGDKDKICTARHSYKTCPTFIIPQWDKFLALVNKYITEMGGKVVVKPSKPTTPTLSTTKTSALPYKVKVIDTDKAGLNVRSGSGVNNPIVTTIKYGEVYTVVSVTKVGSSTWGLLKAYKEKRNGWINVGSNYVTKVK